MNNIIWTPSLMGKKGAKVRRKKLGNVEYIKALSEAGKKGGKAKWENKKLSTDGVLTEV